MEFELTIRFAPGKPPTVSGPIENKMLCYGMLEVARDIIRDYKPGQIEVAGGKAPAEVQRLLQGLGK